MTHDHTERVLDHLIGKRTVTSEEKSSSNPIQPVYADLLALKRAEDAGKPQPFINRIVNRIDRTLDQLKISKADSAPGFQPDYHDIKNRAIMSFAGCYEAPYMLMNPNATGPEVEKDVTCLDLARKEIQKDIRSGTRHGYWGSYSTSVLNTIKEKYIIGDAFDTFYNILKRSKNPDSNRDLLMRLLMLKAASMSQVAAGNFDGSENVSKIKKATNHVPLDPGTRKLFLTKQDGIPIPSMDYIKNPPDKIIGKAIGNIIIKSLITWENDGSMIKDEVQKMEIDLINNHGPKFLPRTIESLSASDFPATRSALACMHGLSLDTSMELSKDTPSVQSSLAKCTDDCSVLDSMNSNPGLTRPTAKIVKERFTKACK